MNQEHPKETKSNHKNNALGDVTLQNSQPQRAISDEENSAEYAERVIALKKEQSFSGPVPHPSHAEHYESILEGSFDRMLSMAERELNHQQTLDKFSLEASIQDSKSGRLYGLIALVALIIAAVITGLYDHEILAGAFLTTGALGTISTLVMGRRQKNN
ncbi:DUF2335 domain-containing protein [Stappia sp. GBMRC 2046]|uniref:DUF2335 domain-containing protein n=1 Tax=Stappia sediminis TaxID=2692190 RepID=A0A7X3LUH8_9HYPH|nr:DUF2335 domain-containing protein [Stappia sediminis]MXN65352.1 DUF2335 domain-containing protein [Stappia sediminis]